MNGKQRMVEQSKQWLCDALINLMTKENFQDMLKLPNYLERRSITLLKIKKRLLITCVISCSISTLNNCSNRNRR